MWAIRAGAPYPAKHLLGVWVGFELCDGAMLWCVEKIKREIRMVKVGFEMCVFSAEIEHGT